MKMFKIKQNIPEDKTDLVIEMDKDRPGVGAYCFCPHLYSVTAGDLVAR